MRRLAIAALLAACGGSSPRATVAGRVDGSPLLTTNAGAFVVRTSGTPTVDILLSNAGDGCAANAANLRNKQVLSLGVTGLGGDPIAPGDFGVYDQQSGAIPSGTVVFADYHSTNSTCGDSTPPNTIGASGHVELTHVDIGQHGTVSGKFDLLLQNGDHLKGTFDAPICPDTSSPGADAGCH